MSEKISQNFSTPPLSNSLSPVDDDDIALLRNLQKMKELIDKWGENPSDEKVYDEIEELDQKINRYFEKKDPRGVGKIVTEFSYGLSCLWYNIKQGQVSKSEFLLVKGEIFGQLKAIAFMVQNPEASLEQAYTLSYAFALQYAVSLLKDHPDPQDQVHIALVIDIIGGCYDIEKLLKAHPDALTNEQKQLYELMKGKARDLFQHDTPELIADFIKWADDLLSTFPQIPKK